MGLQAFHLTIAKYTGNFFSGVAAFSLLQCRWPIVEHGLVYARLSWRLLSCLQASSTPWATKGEAPAS